MNTMPAIEIKDLCKTYKGNAAPAVDHLSLTIPRGEIMGLLGPNGAGKTTIIHILCGLRSFDKGEVTICTHSLRSRLKAIRPLIGVVPQDIALYPALTACENLKIFGSILGLKGDRLESRINELLSLFGLENNKHRRIQNYSGGMKRRINLIVGLLHNPPILFLDEPTGLDPHSRLDLWHILKELKDRGETTLILTTHYMEEAESLCTQVAFIDEGKIIRQGAPGELIRQSEGCASLEMLYLQLTGKKLRD